MTLVPTENVLFATSVSLCAAVTVNEASMPPTVGGAVTVIVRAGADPVGTLSVSAHATEVPVAVHVQPEPAAETNVVFGDSVATSWTLVAVVGPAFATATVYTSGIPRKTGSGASVALTWRSSFPGGGTLTVVWAMAVLFPTSGSVAVALTVAVLATVVGLVGAESEMLIVLEAAAARVGRVQTMVLPGVSRAHVQPVPVALTKVVPAGSGSSTSMVCALTFDGFCTVSV